MPNLQPCCGQRYAVSDRFSTLAEPTEEALDPAGSTLVRLLFGVVGLQVVWRLLKDKPLRAHVTVTAASSGGKSFMVSRILSTSAAVPRLSGKRGGIIVKVTGSQAREGYRARS